jgi:hypothetical protein
MLITQLARSHNKNIARSYTYYYHTVLAIKLSASQFIEKQLVGRYYRPVLFHTYPGSFIVYTSGPKDVFISVREENIE